MTSSKLKLYILNALLCCTKESKEETLFDRLGFYYTSVIYQFTTSDSYKKLGFCLDV